MEKEKGKRNKRRRRKRDRETCGCKGSQLRWMSEWEERWKARVLGIGGGASVCGCEGDW